MLHLDQNYDKQPSGTALVPIEGSEPLIDKLLEEFCISLSEKIKENFQDFNLILSPAIGGIIIGYEIGRILNIETIFVERVNNNFQIRRGFEINRNHKILVVEDVITTGKSSLECSSLAEKCGAEIVGYASLIDRTGGKSEIKKKIVSQVKLDISTFTADNIPENLKKLKAVKPGSRNL